jgi:hypothetical protein
LRTTREREDEGTIFAAGGQEPRVRRCSDFPILTCTLALGVGACGSTETSVGLFGEGGNADDKGTAGESDGAPSSGADEDDDDEHSSGPDGVDEDSGGNDPKFDIGMSTDLTGGSGDTGEGCKYLDMLFVVDISGSMSEEKANLNANFPDFVQVLDDYVADPSKGALGYRLGVTNSSFQSDGSTTGLDGGLVNNGGFAGGDDCGTGGTRWLDGPAAGIAQNFTCLADNPKACTNSCSDLGTERPMDAMMGFVDKHAEGEVNEGFYRGDESLLVIVTLTDEDDQSMISPAGAKADLDAFTQGEERYVLVTVAGPQNMGCTSAFGDASPAPRLNELTTSVPNGLMGDICQGDLTQALQEALALITFSCDTLPPPAG